VAMKVMFVFHAVITETSVVPKFLLRVLNEENGIGVNVEPCMLRRVEYFAHRRIFGNLDDLLISSSRTVEIYFNFLLHWINC
jgi:hypothetical protein